MEEEFKWPTEEGVWMAWISDDIQWFPLQAQALRDDLPTADEIRREREGEKMPPREVLAIVAQFPESESSWPYLFPGNHPVKRWRKPTDEELSRAKHFYGITE